MATAATSVEYMTLQKNASLICDTVTNCVGIGWLADQLSSEGFIDPQATSDLMSTQGISQREKCRQLMSAVDTQTRVNPQNYHKFIKILQGNIVFDSTVAMLEETYGICQSGSIERITSLIVRQHSDESSSSSDSSAEISDFKSEYAVTMAVVVDQINKEDGALGRMRTALKTLRLKKFVPVTRSKEFQEVKTAHDFFGLLNIRAVDCYNNLLHTLIRASCCQKALSTFEEFLQKTEEISPFLEVKDCPQTNHSPERRQSSSTPQAIYSVSLDAASLQSQHAQVKVEAKFDARAISLKRYEKSTRLISGSLRLPRMAMNYHRSDTGSITITWVIAAELLPHILSVRMLEHHLQLLSRLRIMYIRVTSCFQMSVPTLAYWEEPWRLIKAAKEGDLERVSSLLRAGVEVNIKDENGWTAMMLASQHGHLETVNALIAAGAAMDIQNKNGATALMVASENGHLETVNALLAAGAAVDIRKKDGWTALMVASQNGHLETVNALFAAGAAVDIQKKNGATALMVASQNGHLETVNALLAAGAAVDILKKDGWTALMVASQNGHLDTVNALIAAGAALDIQEEDGWTAMMFASQDGHLETVNALIAAGAALDIQEENGATALMVASQNGHLETVNALLAAGAAVDIRKKDGRTAMMAASYNGHPEVVRELVRRGATVDVQDKDGDTALIHAVSQGELGAVQELVKQGAIVDICNKDGLNALMIASKDGKTEVVKVLLEGKADPNTQEKSSGWTALHFAVKEGHLETVKVLISGGADKSLADNNGDVPLAVAEVYGQQEMYEELTLSSSSDTQEAVEPEPLLDQPQAGKEGELPQRELSKDKNIPGEDSTTQGAYTELQKQTQSVQRQPSKDKNIPEDSTSQGTSTEPQKQTHSVQRQPSQTTQKRVRSTAEQVMSLFKRQVLRGRAEKKAAMKASLDLHDLQKQLIQLPEKQSLQKQLKQRQRKPRFREVYIQKAEKEKAAMKAPHDPHDQLPEKHSLQKQLKQQRRKPRFREVYIPIT